MLMIKELLEDIENSEDENAAKNDNDDADFGDVLRHYTNTTESTPSNQRELRCPDGSKINLTF